MNTQPEQDRLQGLADQHRADARRPQSLEEMANELPDIEPTDMEILDVMVDDFGMTHLKAIERLICIDFVTLRKELS